MASFLRGFIFRAVESNIHGPQVRLYARWSHRRPRRVLTAEEYKEEEEQNESKQNTHASEEKVIELDMETDMKPQTHVSSKWVPKDVKLQTELEPATKPVHFKITPIISNKKKPKAKIHTETTDMLETVIGADGTFVYTKLKDNDPVVGPILVTVKSRKKQEKKDLVLLEGKRLIKDALQGGCTLKYLIFSRKNDVEELKPYLPKLGAKLYKMPYKEIQLWSDLTTTPGIMGIFKSPDVANYKPKQSIPLTIICDNIREPGNLGAILRTAAGVGARSLILTKGCVDLWDTKVIRSACGAHFNLQILTKTDWTEIKAHIHPDSTVFVADNKIVSQTLPPALCDTSEIDTDVPMQSLENIIITLPLLPYYGVNFSNAKEMVLIVGGETEGISEDSYRLAAEFQGARLNIPLSNNLDSLNTGTAIGIIMFEIKRQLLNALFKKDNALKQRNAL